MSLEHSDSSYIGERIGWLYVVLNINLFLLWLGKKKNHIWHKYKQLFPPGERYAQVSWRQFKCNGASKLIFPKIIQSQRILTAFLNSLPACDPPHSPHLGFQSFSWEYIEHRSAFQRAACSSFLIAKSFILPGTDFYLVTSFKTVCNFKRLFGMLRRVECA